MEERNNNRAIVAMSLALFFVIILLIVLFILSPDEEQDGIILPDHSVDSVITQSPNNEQSIEFVEITTENVVQALQGMQRPDYYHQVYTVSVGNQNRQLIRTVELWKNGQLLHAEVNDDRQIKSVLTDGTVAWIWYDQDLAPISLQLSNFMTVEDILGLPAFDYLQTLQDANIVTAEYQIDEANMHQSIYVCVQNETLLTNRYWIDLKTGLLNSADALDQSVQVYQVTQKDFSLLAQGDEAFSGRFCLPDGTEPFVVKREMPLP